MSFGFINYHKKQGEVTEMTDGNNVFIQMLETIEENANNNIRNFCQQKLAFPLLFYRIINKSQQK